MRAYSWLSSKLAPGDSPLGGQGLFAREPVAAGEIVGVWGGIVLTDAEAERGRAGDPRFDNSCVRVADGFHFGPVGAPGRDHADLFNHSCEGNAGLDGQVVLRARRRIAPREEVTLDYETFEIDLPAFTCRCGSRACRGVIDGSGWQSPAFRERNRGWLSPHVERRTTDRGAAIPADPPTITHPLHSFDEFTRLRAVVVGRPQGANHPAVDVSFENFFRPPPDAATRTAAVGPVPQGVIDEIEEDIAGLRRVLEARGVEVHRPVASDSSGEFRTPAFASNGLYSLMPRDCLLVVGDVAVEVPSPTRARYFETFPFRPLLEAYQARGAHVVAAPKPVLGASSFQPGVGDGLTEAEVLFDGANCVRVGRDIFLDVNRSANRRAVEWLGRTLRGLVDSRIRIHPMSLGTDHADVTLVPLRPGVILVDPARVTARTLPAPFRTWDRVAVEEVLPTRDYGLPYPLASNDGIGRNVLALDPDTLVVDALQLPLIRALERRRFTVIPLPYRHGRTLGGAWHCVTLDTYRDGGCDDYF